MNPVSQSLLGLLDFAFKFLIVMYLFRMLAIKLHDKPAGQALGALLF